MRNWNGYFVSIRIPFNFNSWVVHLQYLGLDAQKEGWNDNSILLQCEVKLGIKIKKQKEINCQ